MREQLGANDYGDPGWFTHPKGRVAHEWKGPAAEASAPRQTTPGQSPGAPSVRKPGAGHEHH